MKHALHLPSVRNIKKKKKKGLDIDLGSSNDKTLRLGGYHFNLYTGPFSSLWQRQVNYIYILFQVDL